MQENVNGLIFFDMFEFLLVNYFRFMLINLRYFYSCKSILKKFNLI